MSDIASSPHQPSRTPDFILFGRIKSHIEILCLVAFCILPKRIEINAEQIHALSAPLSSLHHQHPIPRLSFTMFIVRSLYFILPRIIFVENKLVSIGIGWYSKALGSREIGGRCNNRRLASTSTRVDARLPSCCVTLQIHM